MRFSDVRIVESSIQTEPDFTTVRLCIVCDESVVDIVLTEQELTEMLTEIQRISSSPPITS